MKAALALCVVDCGTSCWEHFSYLMPRISAISDPGRIASRGRQLNAFSPPPVGRNKLTVTAKPKLVYIRYLIVIFENPRRVWSRGDMP